MEFKLNQPIDTKTLDRILEQSCDHQPKVVTPEEYSETCKEYDLKPGGILSNDSIMKIMELGWLKIWNISDQDLDRQIQAAKIDLRLGHEFWFYGDHNESILNINSAVDVMKEKDLLQYSYKAMGESFIFHPNGLVLAMTHEGLALSNVVDGSFDGKSKPGRLGVSNHQTAGDIDPGFSGQIMMEISNTNKYFIEWPVMKEIASIKFWLLDKPSSRPRQFKIDSESHANDQVSPFGYRMPQWEEIKQTALRRQEEGIN